MEPGWNPAYGVSPSAAVSWAVTKQDLSSGVDVLLIFGISHSAASAVNVAKDFAKEVHRNGGIVVFVYRTKLAQSVWGGIIDFWVEWDCDCWVRGYKSRKPGTYTLVAAEIANAGALPAIHIVREPGEPAWRHVARWESAGTFGHPVDLTDDDESSVREAGGKPGSSADNLLCVG